MKALLGPANINADDEGTGLTLIHTGSSARQDARVPFLYFRQTYKGRRLSLISPSSIQALASGA
jgi:hypothetical protein